MTAITKGSLGQFGDKVPQRRGGLCRRMEGVEGPLVGVLVVGVKGWRGVVGPLVGGFGYEFEGVEGFGSYVEG